MDLTAELVATLPERIEDPGPIPGIATADSYYPEAAATALARLGPDEPLWIFAIGSLIWKHPYEVLECRAGLIRGWHRRFCLGPDTRYRGNPAAPGFMLTLDRGGSCHGIVQRIARDAFEPLLRAEPPVPPRLVRALTPEGTVRAFAFVMDRRFRGYCPRPDDEVARHLACAVGMFGSMPAYLRNTILGLESHGIHDCYLWRMQRLVARQMRGGETDASPD